MTELDVLNLLICVANLFLLFGQQNYVIPAALHSHSTEISPLLRPTETTH